MKKTIKIVLLVLLSLLLLYSIFVLEESIRLKHGSLPLIITGGVCSAKDIVKPDLNGYNIDCKGLGYSIKREYRLGGMIKDDNEYRVIREEFWLFDKYLLWASVS